MKNFTRTNLLFSLCGLNCALCSMHLGGYCPGCGGGEGNQPCKIARCRVEKSELCNIEYCFQCQEYPCHHYDDIDSQDSFITHRNQRRDLEKAMSIGMEAYNAEQTEKYRILKELLQNYNDGRKKTLFCLGANLLELTDLQDILRKAETDAELQKQPVKQKAAVMAKLMQKKAVERGVELKLRKHSK